ncbi:hypothetical protein [Actinomadura sp. 9N407]|uniref:hypothetical protein n=1 Tax=Actinomadura sp. 9N407 TaxID=3375154 RepID=UPI003788E7A5
MKMPVLKVRVVMAAVFALGLLFSTASSCTSAKCHNGECTVTFEGGPGSTTVSGLDDAEVALIAVEGDRVHVSIGGQQAELTKGVLARLAGKQVVATEVTAEKVVLRIV